MLLEDHALETEHQLIDDDGARPSSGSRAAAADGNSAWAVASIVLAPTLLPWRRGARDEREQIVDRSSVSVLDCATVRLS